MQYAFLERRYRRICIALKEKNKRGDALYYVMTQTQCIYILCYASNEAGAQAERERRESEWGIEDLDQEEEE